MVVNESAKADALDLELMTNGRGSRSYVTEESEVGTGRRKHGDRCSVGFSGHTRAVSWGIKLSSVLRVPEGVAGPAVDFLRTRLVEVRGDGAAATAS